MSNDERAMRCTMCESSGSSSCHLGKAGVGEVGGEVLIQKDIVRLEVTVPHAERVQVHKCLNSLAHAQNPLPPPAEAAARTSDLSDAARLA